MPDTVSAIIPTFNRRAFLGRALESILSQSRAPTEILVVDDGSTDGTADYLHGQFEGLVKVIRQENAGVSAARRTGLIEAKGEWVAFLDSDDEWLPGRMKSLLEAADLLGNEIDWIFGDTRVVYDDAVVESFFRLHGLSMNSETTTFLTPQCTQYPTQFSLLQSSLIRRNFLLSISAFDDELRSSEDFLVSFRASLRAPLGAIPDLVTNLYRTGDLIPSSLDGAGKGGSDYFRARILAFGEAVSISGARPWARLHEESVRGLCHVLAREGLPLGKLPLEQFRHRISAKAIGFALAALPGGKFLRFIDHLRHFAS